MASKYDKTTLDILLGFQTRLQGVGNSLADELQKLISSTDSAILKTIVNKLPSAKSDIKTQMRELEKLAKEIEKIRAEGFDLAEMKAYAYGNEIAKQAGSTVAKLADDRGKIFKKNLSEKQISEVLHFAPIDGQSISQWFHAMKTSDLERITQAVQRASVEGMSVSKVVKAIRGTKENDYKDGVLETTRNSATMTARTIVNGVASNAMLETCSENSDVIDGIKFVATLDAKTCPFCGSYDGKVWKPDEAAQVKRPPLHPNCRCTVIPYIDMGDELEGDRPAANADFDKLAEDAYNKQAREKRWKRRYEDLSPSTRLKYYYQAQKDFTKETGKPAYNQVSGNTTFREYFEKQDAAFQKAWLGPKRYALYKEGNYDPLKLGNPDTGYAVPVEKLEPSEPEVKIPEGFPDSLSELSLDYVGRGTDKEGNRYNSETYDGSYPADTLKIRTVTESLYEKIGVKFTDSRLYQNEKGETVRVFRELPSDMISLEDWWKSASHEQREKMKPTVQKVMAADAVLGQERDLGVILHVDSDGNLWDERRGIAILGRGYHSKGQFSPDSLTTETLRNFRNRVDKSIKFSDLARSLSNEEIAPILRNLSDTDRNVVTERMGRIRKAGEQLVVFENEGKHKELETRSAVQTALNGEAKDATSDSGNEPKGKKNQLTKNVTIPTSDKELDDILAESRKEEKEIDKQIRALADEYYDLMDKYPEERRSGKIRVRLEEITDKTDELEDKRKNLILNKILGPVNPESENYKGAMKIKIPKGMDKEVVQKGLSTVARAMDVLGVDVDWTRIHVKKLPPGERAFHRNRTIHLTTAHQSATASHECGHAVESMIPALGRKVRKVRDSYALRRNGKPVEGFFRVTFPDSNYGWDEKYYEPKDRGLVPSLYTMKVYNRNSDEMVSMFFETLERNPESLITKYRTWYKDMVKCFQ